MPGDENSKNRDLSWTKEAFGEVKPRSDSLYGITFKQRTGCGNLFVTINEDEDGRPFEVFVRLGKAGNCTSCLMDAISIMVSYDLRKGISIEVHEAILRNLRCDNPISSIENNGIPVHSCADGIAQVIRTYLSSKCKKKKEGKLICWNNLEHDDHLCPDCDIHIGEKVELLVKIDDFFTKGSKWIVVGRHEGVDENPPKFDLGASGVPERETVSEDKIKKVVKGDG